MLSITKVLDTLSAILTGFVKSRRPEGWGYWRHVMYTALRAGARAAGLTFARSVSDIEHQGLLVLLVGGLRTIRFTNGDWYRCYRTMSTAGMYRRFARMKGLRRELVDIGEGASGGWFGKKNASKILLYFHGWYPRDFGA